MRSMISDGGVVMIEDQKISGDYFDGVRSRNFRMVNMETI